MANEAQTPVTQTPVTDEQALTWLRNVTEQVHVSGTMQEVEQMLALATKARSLLDDYLQMIAEQRSIREVQ